MACACKHEIHYDGGKFCIDWPAGEEDCVCMDLTPPYNDSLSADEQITMEEKIASLIQGNTAADEELCQRLSQSILRSVLWTFREDLFKREE